MADPGSSPEPAEPSEGGGSSKRAAHAAEERVRASVFVGSNLLYAWRLIQARANELATHVDTSSKSKTHDVKALSRKPKPGKAPPRDDPPLTAPGQSHAEGRTDF